MALYHFFLSLLFTIPCLTSILSSGAVLQANEVVALGNIAQTLGKTNWNFSVDPCSGQSGWINPNPAKGFEDAVTCDCSFSNNTVCHVVSIVLKSQSLPGSLPKELTQLPYIHEFDVTRNYLNSTLPKEWGSLQLVNVSIQSNRISGPIPKEFGNISTLVSFTAEYNELSGNLPPELGNLASIQRFFVSSNKLTGELPASFANLTTLLDFRISDNQFNGSIPNFIQNWTNLQRLEIRASGFSGPIPYGISQLVNLNDLRISDLNGTATTTIPPLSNLKSLTKLVLKRCNIVRELPDYLWELPTIKLIDFSFNNIVGGIPSNYSALFNVQFIYLTGNLLSGTIPDWMSHKGGSIDISYNNFTIPSSSSSCQVQNINVFGSSFGVNNSGIVPCLRSHTCEKKWYSFHINCGGKQFTAGNITYEADTDQAGPAKFFISPTNWAFSSTGNFLDGTNPYTVTNASQLAANASQLYYDARVSPLSMTYYGFCLGNGNYTVNLHFAELRFTNDKTYNSLGRRVFDVYVQDELILKDFNAAAEAGGAGKPIIKPLQAVVDSGTLSIRFEWAGRGTTAIPDKGDYGPLISAISVIPNFMPPPESIAQSKGISVVVVIVSVVVSVSAALTLLVAGVLWWKKRVRRQRRNKDLKDLNLQTDSFTLRQIKAATNDFDRANKIGEGGFGSVYKGTLSDGTVIAVKQLSSKSKQGNQEFVNEIGTISALQHPHLVKLYGCCMEGNQLLLIYEYMPNNSLARALFGPDEYRLELDWPTRQKICVGIAKGLAYLHEESTLKIVHRDIKATNVLLDEDLNSKISDFGLAKLDVEDGTHISTRIAGTYGYMAPEYAMRGHLTDKADVYSFGIVALEIVSGKSNTGSRTRNDTFYLLDWAHVLKAEDRLIDLIDPRLESNFDREEAMTMIKVGLLCTDALAVVRPPMSYVVEMLEGRIEVQVVDSTPNLFENEMKRKALRDQLHSGDECSALDNQSHTNNATWTTSSSSDIYSDLYPVNLDSQYWEKRI